MELVKKQLVTIICEAQIENNLVEDFDKLEVGGYTICEATGDGSRGVRAGNWEQDRNIRIEIVCSTEEADKIMKHLYAEYYENYAIISYQTDVRVIRDDKFV